MEKNFLLEKEYDFLRTHPKIKNHILLLGLGGSHAYGTNIDTDYHTSDIDVRGILFPTKEDLLGLNLEKFETYQDVETDTILYTFQKMIKLLLECNPNTCEILGIREEDYFYKHPLAQKLIDNSSLFLSQRVFSSFSGYASQQLNRLENALARDSLTEMKKEEHILNSAKSCMNHINDRYTKIPNKSIFLYIDKSEKKDKDSEIFIDINLQHYPLRDLNGIWNEFVSIPRQYEKLNHRNRKKDEMHLDKHAMHLIRLFYMLFDIAEQGKIITYREKERTFLLEVRNGLFRNEYGTYKQEFFDFVKELKDKAKRLESKTDLPPYPNYQKINELVQEIQTDWLKHQL